MGKPSRHILYTETYQQEATQYRNYLLLLGYTEETCQSRYLFLKEFFSWLEAIGIYKLQAITSVEIANFYEYIENRESARTKEKLKLKAVYSIMRCVQSFLGYALDLGKVTINPASHLQLSYPNEVVARRIFTQEEIKELYQATETLQEKAILHMGYGCGLRVQEISDLNKEDVRLTENLVIVQKGKNNKRRLVPISDTISQDLQEFIFSIEEAQTALFINTKGRRMQEWTFNAILKELIERAFPLWGNIKGAIGMHTLRHSIATHLLQNGMKLKQVQQFLGHSFIESTAIYTHINQEQINTLYDDTS